jgi:hypothetical protein
MSAFTDQIVEANLANRIFNELQLGEILGRGDARRYGLVNRALKDGSLVRLKRGKYLLDRRYRSEVIHPFVVAQSLLPGSYISFETALAYHGWIPEAVYTTASVTPGRKTITQDTPSFGLFTYHPLAIHDYQFLASVSREKLGKLTAFIAEPLRALMDLVAFRKEHWIGLDWLNTSMRIDEDRLSHLRRADFSALKLVYKHKAVNEFLHALETSLLKTKATELEEVHHD